MVSTPENIDSFGVRVYKSFLPGSTCLRGTFIFFLCSVISTFARATARLRAFAALASRVHPRREFAMLCFRDVERMLLARCCQLFLFVSWAFVYIWI